MEPSNQRGEHTTTNPILGEILEEIAAEDNQPAPVAWYNWANWANWNNWGNWGNWANWGNWGNYR
jgi:hypothetical protein